MQQPRDMTFRTLKVMPHSWKTDAITNLNFDLVGPFVWWDIPGTKPTEEYYFVCKRDWKSSTADRIICTWIILDLRAQWELRKISGLYGQNNNRSEKTAWEVPGYVLPQTLHMGDEIQYRQSMWQTQEKQIFLLVSGWTALMERTHWESLCIDNLIILNLILVK